MRSFVFVMALLTVNLYGIPQTNSVKTRVMLVGDAGAIIRGQAPVLDAISINRKRDEQTAVVYLEDNLCDAGLPDETYNRYSDIKAALGSQVTMLKCSDAKGYMTPGHNDWENGRPGGYEAIMRQQGYLDQFSRGKIEFFPKRGCPGPVEAEIGDDAVLVKMDSQWWIHQSDKPGIESDCDHKTEDEVISELNDILNRNYNKLILLATHHLFKSNRPHGGYFTWKQHIFPFTEIRENLYISLPVIGSAYPIARGVFGTPQDIKRPWYTNIINRIYASLMSPPKVIGVIKLGAGHIFNDSIGYFRELSLGQNNELRGFRKNRFSGTPMAHGSLELRIKLSDSKSYILPGQASLVVFNDIGRVWYTGEGSNKCHYAAGGGFYNNPFNLMTCLL